MGQFDFVSASFAGIVPDNTAGTTNLGVQQANGVTVMTWSRNVNNGNPTDAQISTTGPTNVMWAIGKTNGVYCVVQCVGCLYAWSCLSLCRVCTNMLIDVQTTTPRTLPWGLCRWLWCL